MGVVHPVLAYLLSILYYLEVSNGSVSVVTHYGNNGKESEDRSRCDDDCSFCPAYHGDWYHFQCTRNNVQLTIGYCMTRDETGALFVTKCPYFQLEGHNKSDPGNFKLPDNISELNDYMCGSMNRKGFLCEDCVDGFAVSFTSMGHKCSNCTDAWYGIPLYLLIELVPITVFYFFVLIFRIHITSSPMTCLILYCNFIQFLLADDRYPPIERIVPLYENNILFKVSIFFYSLWNLDFVRYVSPPFCISESFKLIHTILLGYVSVLYPLFLMALTWVCIKLHDENFRPVVWLWRPFHSCLVKIRKGYGSKNSIIDVFSTFFLLSYSKLMFQTLFFFSCTEVRNISDDSYYLIMEYEPTTRCGSSSFTKYPIAVPALLSLFIFNILPVFLMIFYPIKVFRRCLSKCKLDSFPLTAFTEKFYSCYRDGLDGGRDMRSFAGFYFLLRYLPFFYYGFQMQYTFLTLWIYCFFLFFSSSILIALVQPYKSTYMNILDTLLLGLTACACAVLSQNTTRFENVITQFLIVFFLPLVAFGVILVLCVLIKSYQQLSTVVKAKLLSQRNLSISEREDQLQSLLDNRDSHRYS